MLYIGTTNPGKLSEFAGILAPLGLDLEPIALDVPEPADTFEENARLKALGYAEATGGITISEDSGLVIPALNGLPGPWSARFSDLVISRTNTPMHVVPSGRDRDTLDRLNNEKVLRLMEGFEQPHRAAKFVVRLVVARPNEVLFEAGGEAHGWVSKELRGTNGFGYDPLFIGQDTFGKTYAELDSLRKNLRSHRKQVLKEFRYWVSKALREGVLS